MDYRGIKRPRDVRSDDEDEEERPNKIPRNEIIEKLTLMGNALGSTIEAGTASTAELAMIETQFKTALNNVLEFGKQQALEREEAKRTLALEDMEREEQLQRENVRQEFLRNLEPITKQMKEKLTYGEQARIFGIVVKALNDALDDTPPPQPLEEPNHVARMADLITFGHNYAMEQLSVTLSNMYNATPEVTRQTVALLTTSLLLYNYQPQAIRALYVGIPYFGQLFELMNRSNNYLRIVTNSAGVVTSIFYLLRNAGIDLTPAINGARAMAGGVASSCASAAVSAAASAGLYACEQSGSILNSINKSASGVLKLVADRLGELATSEYANLRIPIEQGDSLGSESTGLSQLSSMSGLSTMSEESMRSIGQLLNTPVIDGGAGINQNTNAVTAPIIQERFNAIEQGAIVDPIIATPLDVVTADVAIPMARVVSDSLMSDITEGSQRDDASQGSEVVEWHEWLFGPSTTRGGKRMRRSKRNMKLRKTRKIKKVRKNIITKKGKKHNKTLKRHKNRWQR